MLPAFILCLQCFTLDYGRISWLTNIHHILTCHLNDLLKQLQLFYNSYQNVSTTTFKHIKQEKDVEKTEVALAKFGTC